LSALRLGKAFDEGQQWQKRYQDSKGAGWDFEDSLREIEWATKGLKISQSAKLSSIPSNSPKLKDTDRLRISLVGHSYLTLESYANLNILRRLREKAVVELTEHVKPEDANSHLLGLRKKLFWNHAKQIYGSGNKFVKDPQVDGVIYLSCFGCGTDSMVQEMLARVAREQHKPYMVVTLDEHSGEAGLITRLEAFLDMVERRKVHEGNLSTHG